MFNNSRGFTLIEMLIVLLIISVLIILIIPNISKQTTDVNDKGCDALISVVESQTQSFYLEKGRYPKNIDELKENGFIKKNQTTCPNNKKISVSSDGEVTVS